MLADLRSAWRYISHQPGFALLAILSLGVAIGVNVAMLSVVNGFLLRDAVTQDPARYVGVFTATQDAARSYRPFSLAEFEALRSDHTAFADVSAVFYSQVALGESASARRVFSFLVSDNFFSLAGARPAAGRFFTTAEAAPESGATVVVASHRLWRSAGLSPAFIGSTLRINGQTCTVIGVAPEGFSGASPLLAPEVWLPLGFFREAAPAFAADRASASLGAPGNFQLQLFARLQPGFTRTTVAPRLPALAQRLAALESEPSGTRRELILARPFGIAPEPARESAFAPVTALTLGLSSLVLMVACLNLSNLLLARGSTRTAEIATRVALGASRLRIVRQLLAEGLLLGLAGSLLGVVCSWWAGTFLARVLASRVTEFGFQVVTTFETDGRLLAVTTVIALLASLAFSLGPALRASQLDLTRDLKSGAHGAIAGAGRSLWSGRSLLLVVQAAVAFVLLFAAGLFLRSALAAAEPPTGLDPARRAVAELDFSLQPAAAALPRVRALQVLEQVRRSPGFASVGLTSLVPYANDVQLSRSERPDEAAANRHPVVGAFAAISDGYLPAVTTLLHGRDFFPAEAADPHAAPVCIIDETLARRHFARGHALGQTIRVRGGPRNQVDRLFTIVGIVAAHSQDVADHVVPFPRVFVPLSQIDHPRWFLVAQGAHTGAQSDLAAARALESALRAIDPDLPVADVRTFDAFLAQNFSRWQAGLGAVLFSLFGLIAALLAAVGIYGVTAYAMARRTREIGLRLALGARRTDIARLVAGRSLHQLLAACGLGTLAAAAVGTALAGFVPGVHAVDPLALALAASVLLLASAPALLFPSLRATRVDPMIALRAE